MGLGEASAKQDRLCSDILLAPISWIGAEIWGWTGNKKIINISTIFNSKHFSLQLLEFQRTLFEKLIFIQTAINPTLHGLKNVAGDTGGGHYGHPLENDPRGHFCGQIDL